MIREQKIGTDNNNFAGIRLVRGLNDKNIVTVSKNGDTLKNRNEYNLINAISGTFYRILGRRLLKTMIGKLFLQFNGK